MSLWQHIRRMVTPPNLRHRLDSQSTPRLPEDRRRPSDNPTQRVAMTRPVNDNRPYPANRRQRRGWGLPFPVRRRRNNTQQHDEPFFESEGGLHE